MEQRLGDAVGLDRATGEVDDRDPAAGCPAVAEVVAQPHRAGGVAAHRRDPAVRGARAERQHGGGLAAPAGRSTCMSGSAGRSRDRSPKAAQWPSPLIGSFGTEPSSTSTNGSSRPAAASPERAHELLAALEREHRVVDRQPRHSRASRRGAGPRGSGWWPPSSPPSRRRSRARSSATARGRADARRWLLPGANSTPRISDLAGGRRRHELRRRDRHRARSSSRAGSRACRGGAIHRHGR